MKDLGIYIHIPFCKSKCFYCDFCSKAIDEINIKDKEQINEYIDCICMEILSNTDVLSQSEISSIYIGGGTPSLIDSKHIQKILDVLNLFNNKATEITIEINPGTCNEEKLKHYYKVGINRLSIGLQTIHDSSLTKIGRNTSLKDFETLYNNAINIGFKNISLDLIIGLPDESLDMFKETINYVVNLKNITHISAYSLEIYENTQLYFLIKNNFLTPVDDDMERQMKHLLDNILEENGFIRYEISNYAKKGYESKHNLKYWLQKEYLGFGVSAASYLSSARYLNVSNITEYIKNTNKGLSFRSEIEELDKLATMKEYIILRLRLRLGINTDDFYNQFKTDIYDLFKFEIDKLIQDGLLKKNKNNIFLSEKGNDLANIVWEKFI